jgi:hypothetical protein
MELGLVHLSKLIRAQLKFLSPPCVKVMQIDIGCKHDVLVCFEGIAESFENPKYVKPYIMRVLHVVL